VERHFQRELEGLKTSLIKMGSVAEESIGYALRAAMERNAALKQKVEEAEGRINSLEIEIDNAVIDLLALQQPVASDLRFIIAAQKINNDLERIGDHAVNIAQAADFLLKSGEKESLPEISKMADIARAMLKNALDSFILIDAPLAQKVLETDDQVDALNLQVMQHVIELVKSGKMTIEFGLPFILISRNLERVADLATNIAEEVIFHKQARVVKHHAEEKPELPDK
jgi:phosphate transport system protein